MAKAKVDHPSATEKHEEPKPVVSAPVELLQVDEGAAVQALYDLVAACRLVLPSTNPALVRAKKVLGK